MDAGRPAGLRGESADGGGSRLEPAVISVPWIRLELNTRNRVFPQMARPVLNPHSSCCSSYSLSQSLYNFVYFSQSVAKVPGLRSWRFYSTRPCRWNSFVFRCRRFAGVLFVPQAGALKTPRCPLGPHPHTHPPSSPSLRPPVVQASFPAMLVKREWAKGEAPAPLLRHLGVAAVSHPTIRPRPLPRQPDVFLNASQNEKRRSVELRTAGSRFLFYFIFSTQPPPLGLCRKCR